MRHLTAFPRPRCVAVFPAFGKPSRKRRKSLSVTRAASLPVESRRARLKRQSGRAVDTQRESWERHPSFVVNGRQRMPLTQICLSNNSRHELGMVQQIPWKFQSGNYLGSGTGADNSLRSPRSGFSTVLNSVSNFFRGPRCDQLDSATSALADLYANSNPRTERPGNVFKQ
jgi:hypothetical protein